MNDLPKLGPTPLKERRSILFVEYGQIDVRDGAFVVIDDNGERTQIPVGSVAVLMLEPGTRVSHAAVVLASRVSCLLVWIGEAGSWFGAHGLRQGMISRWWAIIDAVLLIWMESYSLPFREEDEGEVRLNNIGLMQVDRFYVVNP